MKQFSLSGSPRESVGRKGATELRRGGRIPGVIYGGTEQVPFSVLSNDWDKVLRLSDTLNINIDIDGKSYSTVIQEMQKHPVSDKMTHIDLLQLIPGKVLKTALPVRTFGNSEGIKAGGKLLLNYRRVRIAGLPEDLPEEIKLDISALNIGDMIRVRDLNYPGCKILEADASAVVTIEATRASIADATAAAKEATGGKKK